MGHVAARRDPLAACGLRARRYQLLPHHDRRIRAYAPELAGGANGIWHPVTGGPLEAERWEVVLGGRREQVQRAHSPRLRVGDDACDERAPEPATAPLASNGGRAQQRVVAADLESNDSDEAPVALGDDEVSERIGDPVDGKCALSQERVDRIEVGGSGRPKG